MRLLALCSIAILLQTACQENFDNRLQRETREFTKNHCPQEIEPGCILDSISYDCTNRTYTWWYQLSDTGVWVFQQNASLLHHRLKENLQNDTELKALKSKGINFRYVYRSSCQGNIVYETTIQVDEYGMNLRH